MVIKVFCTSWIFSHNSNPDGCKKGHSRAGRNHTIGAKKSVVFRKRSFFLIDQFFLECALNEK
jgi:hypothetical protein